MPKRKRSDNAPLLIEHAGVKVYRVPHWEWDTMLDHSFSLQEIRQHEVEPLDFDIRDLPGGATIDYKEDTLAVTTVIQQAIENGGLEQYTFKAKGLA